MAHASVVSVLVRLVAPSCDRTDDLVDDAWLDVYRSWPSISRSPHRLAAALAPFVRRAVQAAEADEVAKADTAGRRGSWRTLELRDDVMLGAPGLRGQQTGDPNDEGDRVKGNPGDRSMGRAFANLEPRERALVALSVYVGLGDRDLRRAVGWLPPKPAYTMHRARRDVLLTAAPEFTGPPSGVRVTESTVMQRRLQRVLTEQAGPVTMTPQADFARLQSRLATVTQRRALPRPGPVGLALAGFAAGVAITAGFLVVTHQPDLPTASALPLPPPSAGPGMRLAGYHSVAVSIPNSWGHNRVECGEPVADTTVYTDATRSGPCLRRVGPTVGNPQHSSITFKDPPSSLLVVGRVREITRVSGLAVYSGGRERRDQLWTEVILVPRAHVELIVSSRRSAVLDQVIASLQVLPTGYTTVPPCERLALRDAIHALTLAGLHVRLTQASTLSAREDAPPVTHQTIAAGAVVAVGTTVGLGFPSMN